MTATPAFTNVFVNPAAYRSFLATGKWPDKTMLVLEVRASASKGSINKGGSYQSDLLGIEAEVKDTAKFPGNGWAFFAFGKSSTGKMLPRTEDCYACHRGPRGGGQHVRAVLSRCCSISRNKRER